MRPPSTGSTADVVFAFAYLTWARSRDRGGFMAQDRFAATLLDHPRVDGLLVANQHRSVAAKVLRIAAGAAPPPSRPARPT